MTLACVICWQAILPAERHVVFDGSRGQGEHLACLPSTADVQVPPESHKLGAPGATPGSAPSFRRRESRRSPGQPSQAPKGLVLRAAAVVGGNPSSCAAALPAAVAPRPPAVAPPRGRGARSTSTSLHAAPGRDGTRTGPCHAGGVPLDTDEFEDLISDAQAVAQAKAASLNVYLGSGS